MSGIIKFDLAGKLNAVHEKVFETKFQKFVICN